MTNGFWTLLFAKAANGVYVVEDSKDNNKYIYYIINNGCIIEQGINSKRL